MPPHFYLLTNLYIGLQAYGRFREMLTFIGAMPDLVLDSFIAMGMIIGSYTMGRWLSSNRLLGSWHV